LSLCHFLFCLFSLICYQCCLVLFGKLRIQFLTTYFALSYCIMWCGTIDVRCRLTCWVVKLLKVRTEQLWFSGV